VVGGEWGEGEGGGGGGGRGGGEGRGWRGEGRVEGCGQCGGMGDIHLCGMGVGGRGVGGGWVLGVGGVGQDHMHYHFSCCNA